jgi:phage portal protein BeeE
MLQSTIAGEPITEQTALRIADVLSCVRVVSESVAVLPVHTYRKTASGRVPFQGRITELLRRPGPATTTSNLIAQLTAALVLHGETFLAKYRDGSEVAQLGVLPGSRISVKLVRGLPEYSARRRVRRQ